MPAAGCDAIPEFYVSAESDSGATVTSPFGAPEWVHQPKVGMVAAVIDDDFDVGVHIVENWHPASASGRRLAPGIYDYVLEYTPGSGVAERQVGKLAVEPR